MSRAVIEKDLYGALLSSALMSQIRAEILGYASYGAGVVDITIRGVCCVGGFPEIIVDYGGEILQTYGRALNLVLDDRTAAKVQLERERERCLAIVHKHRLGNFNGYFEQILKEIRDQENDEACR